MKELPNPTFPLSQIGLRAALWPAPATGVSTAVAAARTSVPQAPAVILPPAVESKQGITVGWARHLDDVRAAQRLRYDVFVGEMGARVSSPLAGHDIDLFDDFCEHLLVRDELTGQVIGTYRVLTPAQARRVGSTYSDTEFDLTRLRDLRERMVELGRSCVHPDHRQGGVILALWGALAGFMHRNKLDTMIGCASIPMQHNGVHERRRRGQHLAPAVGQLHGTDPVSGAAPPAAAGRAARRHASTWSRRRSSRATCAWVRRCSARLPGTRISTPPTCRC